MSIADGGGTDLVISGHGIPRYAARGLTQTLAPIDASAVLAYSVNGALLNFSPPQFRKFKTTITCSDVLPPALAALWPGVVVDIDCISPIAYLTTLGSPVPDRTVVRSEIVHDHTYDWLRLTMRVATPWTQDTAEYDAKTSWQLELWEA